MIKKIVAAVGFGLAAYVAYETYTQKTVESDSGEGGYLDTAIGVIEGGFSKVSFNDGLGMQISLAGINHIKGWEGFKADVYLDAGGKATIGYGHLILPHESFGKITESEAVRILVKDLSSAENSVNNAVKVPLTQNQYDALVSFVFNVGGGAFRRSTLLKKINSGELAAAKTEFLKWVNAGGKRVQGLVNRRVADAKLFEGVA
ncbi:MAG: lysozyme [Pseudomonadota bacterium]